MILLANASAQSGMYMGAIKQIIISLPSIQEQQAIADYLDSKCTQVENTIKGKQNLIKKLTSYKKSLIYECVTGKREFNI